MPKVLKRGTHDGRAVVGEYKCTGKGNGNCGCGATLEVYKDDLYQTSSSDYTGDTDYFTTFCCPQCNAETDIRGSTYQLPDKSEHPLSLVKSRVFRKISVTFEDKVERWENFESDFERQYVDGC